MDALEVPNLASAIPKAENRTASTDRLRAEIKNGQLIWTVEPDTQANQETGSEKEPAQEQENKPEGHPKHELDLRPELDLEPDEPGQRPKLGPETAPDREPGPGLPLTPSPAKPPKNPDNYCCLCLRDPQRKHNASTHFLRECPQLPQRERDHLKMIFENALQKRSLPRDKWPKKLYGPTGVGQSFNLRLINMVEDFYDLNVTGHDDIGEGQDWFA